MWRNYDLKSHFIAVPGRDKLVIQDRGFHIDNGTCLLYSSYPSGAPEFTLVLFLRFMLIIFWVSWCSFWSSWVYLYFCKFSIRSSLSFWVNQSFASFMPLMLEHLNFPYVGKFHAAHFEVFELTLDLRGSCQLLQNTWVYISIVRFMLLISMYVFCCLF